MRARPTRPTCTSRRAAFTPPRCARFCARSESRPPGRASGVELLAGAQHLHELTDALGPGLRFLGALDPEQDRVAVAAVEGREEGLGPGRAIELDLQVGGHAGLARRIVGG